MNKHTTQYLTQGAIIAALYVALTLVSNAFNLALGPVQFRLSEALTVLPYFTAAAIPGLTVGCLLANILCGAALWDVIFGSIATLLGAVFTYKLRTHKWLAPLPPIIANVLIVPPILMLVYQFPGSWLFHFASVGLGEVVCCGILGLLLLRLLESRREVLFPER